MPESIQASGLAFSSTFAVDAKLKEGKSLNELKDFLKPFSALILVSYGTKLLYTIMEKKDLQSIVPIQKSEIEFSAGKVLYRFYFDRPDKYTYSRNLLMFISILASIDKFYILSLDTIYPYIAKALYEASSKLLRQDNTEYESERKHYKEVIENTAGINLFLSKEIQHLKNNLKGVERKLELCKKFCINIIEKTMHEGISSRKELIDLMEEYGIDKQLALESIEIIYSGGIDG